ncbi:hypothetical protein V8C86DRAFT_2833919 [Haematococcus lacustris]
MAPADGPFCCSLFLCMLIHFCTTAPAQSNCAAGMGTGCSVPLNTLPVRCLCAGHSFATAPPRAQPAPCTPC